MLLIQTYLAKMFPPSLQKGERFGVEQEAEVRALEEEACLRGSQLQSVLQVCHMTSELGFLGSTHCRHGSIGAAVDGEATERKMELGLTVTPPHFVRGLLGLVILRMGSTGGM